MKEIKVILGAKSPLCGALTPLCGALAPLSILKVFFIALLFSSCSEDPVKPPPIVSDTTGMFIWSATSPINYPITDMYVADTNAIYLAAGVLLKSSGMYSPQVIDLGLGNSAYSVNGYDKNNIFVGVWDFNFTPSITVLKKITNGVISSYTIQNDTGRGVRNILPMGPNEAWLITQQGNAAYYFNSGTFTQYAVNGGGKAGKFYKDRFGNVYLFALMNGNTTTDYMYSYKFSNSSFQIVSIDTVGSGTGKSGFLSYCGKDILMAGAYSVFYFDGQVWLPHRASQNQFLMRLLGGKSKDDTLYALGPEGISGSGPSSPQIWSGNAWKVEDKGFNFSFRDEIIYPGSYPRSIFIKDRKLYLVVLTFSWSAYLLVGRPAR